MNEFQLIDLITKDFSVNHKNVIKGVGDDCAVWKQGDKFLCYSTDTMVEGDHFLKSWMSAPVIGARAMVQNLSDIAAMGATPTFLFVSLVIDDDTNNEWVKGLYDGIKTKSDKYGLTLLGGNMTHGKNFSITIGIIGESEKEPIYRSGAEVNDLVVVTGNVGGACIARLLLQSGYHPDENLKNKLLKPLPRIEEGKVIATFANSMIDISDGVGSEATHIAKSSNVGVKIYSNKIPMPTLQKFDKQNFKQTSIDCALRGGEDYELMFTITEQNFRLLQQKWPFKTTLTIVGEITKEKRKVLVSNGEDQNLPQGFDHFSSNINQ